MSLSSVQLLPADVAAAEPDTVVLDQGGPGGSLLVAGQDGVSAAHAEVHLSVRAGSREDIGEHTEIATPASVLEPGRQ